MEFEPMLTPREKSPLPKMSPRGGSNPWCCGQWAQALPTQLFRPPLADSDYSQYRSREDHTQQMYSQVVRKREISSWASKAGSKPFPWAQVYHSQDNNNDNDVDRNERRKSRFLQSPLCATNCLQHVHLSVHGVTVCKSRETHWQRCQPHSLTKLTIFKIWQEDFEVGRKILRKCIKRIKLATNCVSQAASNTIYT